MPEDSETPTPPSSPLTPRGLLERLFNPGDNEEKNVQATRSVDSSPRNSARVLPSKPSESPRSVTGASPRITLFPNLFSPGGEEALPPPYMKPPQTTPGHRRAHSDSSIASTRTPTTPPPNAEINEAPPTLLQRLIRQIDDAVGSPRAATPPPPPRARTPSPPPPSPRFAELREAATAAMAKLLAARAATPPPAPSPERSLAEIETDAMEEGKRLHRRGDLEAARAHFLLAHDAQGSAVALLSAANMALRLGNTSDAARDYARALTTPLSARKPGKLSPTSAAAAAALSPKSRPLSPPPISTAAVAASAVRRRSVSRGADGRASPLLGADGSPLRRGSVVVRVKRKRLAALRILLTTVALLLVWELLLRSTAVDTETRSLFRRSAVTTSSFAAAADDGAAAEVSTTTIFSSTRQRSSLVLDGSGWRASYYARRDAARLARYGRRGAAEPEGFVDALFRLVGAQMGAAVLLLIPLLPSIFRMVARALAVLEAIGVPIPPLLHPLLPAAAVGRRRRSSFSPVPETVVLRPPPRRPTPRAPLPLPAATAKEIAAADELFAGRLPPSAGGGGGAAGDDDEAGWEVAAEERGEMRLSWVQRGDVLLIRVEATCPGGLAEIAALTRELDLLAAWCGACSRAEIERTSSSPSAHELVGWGILQLRWPLPPMVVRLSTSLRALGDGGGALVVARTPDDAPPPPMARLIEEHDELPVRTAVARLTPLDDERTTVDAVAALDIGAMLEGEGESGDDDEFVGGAVPALPPWVISMLFGVAKPWVWRPARRLLAALARAPARRDDRTVTALRTRLADDEHGLYGRLGWRAPG
jgi:hypothetical protein